MKWINPVEALRRGIGLVAIAGMFALNPGCECEDQPPSTDLDPCGNRCIPGLEECDPDTGMCVPISDMGDTGWDQPPDTPDLPDGDTTSDRADAPCRSDNDCPADRYCDPEGVCQVGCRVDNPDTQADEDNCMGDLSCHPIRHECVTGCVSDEDCDLLEYCDLETDTCEVGCRLEPDNCPHYVDGETVECDEITHRCVDGPCEEDLDCPDAFWCDPTNDLCTVGCRVDETGDNCGSCEDCDAITRTCLPRLCECTTEASLQDCDDLCNEPDGSISACYCDRADGLCLPGCRIFDNDQDEITDNCRAGTICEETTRQCVVGCRVDVDCPFGTYCDLEELECVPGCQAGQCESTGFCCLEPTGCGDCAYRECCLLSCEEDADCPDGTYCNANGSCIEGCRIDDPATTGIDEDTCEGDLVCDPLTRYCTLSGCTETCGECPLGQYCNESNQCMPGCNGEDACCPPTQPCNSSNGFCGCLSDLDCPDNTYCETPNCVPDCVEGGCPPPLMCDTESGRCVGGCVDPGERLSYQRDDTPETGHCVLFSPTDPDDHCRPDAAWLPPDSYCDGQPLTYCASGYACFGGDQDWYALNLYDGDYLSFGAEYSLPTGGTFSLVLMREPLVLPDGRLNIVATAVDPDPDDAIGEAWSGEIEIFEDGFYYMRIMANADDRVPYDLRIEIDRVYRCFDDGYEPNDLPCTEQSVYPYKLPVVEIPNSPTVWSQDLSICLDDIDYFGIELFSGNQLTAVVNPGRETLTVALGPDVDCQEITPVSYGLPYTDPDDPDDDNIMAIDGYTVGATGYYYLRIQEPSGLAETDYNLEVKTEVGSAVCADDPYEPNDTANPLVFPSAATHRIDSADQLGSSKQFLRGRRCPTSDDDYFRLYVRTGLHNYYLTASLYQADPLLEIALYDSQLNLIDISGEGDATSQIVHQVTETNLDNPDDGLKGNIWVLVRPVSGATIPQLGAVYDLELKYELAPCTDDRFEPNNQPSHAASLHSTLLIGEDQRCGGSNPAFTTICTGGGHDCYCQRQGDLVLCPTNDDWYYLRAIAGDNLSIRLKPTSTVDLFDISLALYRPGEPPTAVETGQYTADSVIIENVGVRSVTGTPIVEYLVEVTAFGQTEPFSYTLDLEVLADYSRNCARDEWDAELLEYPNANETYCQSSSCILQPGGPGIPGRLCYWDPQDWFQFTLSGTSDIRVYSQFYRDQGDMTATVFRDVAEYPGPGAPVYPGCPETTGPGDEDCPCDYIFREADGENYRAGCRIPTSRPTEITAPGRDWVFYDVPAGTYHLRLAMLFGAEVPNAYTAYLKVTPCGDGTWSPGEECDAISVTGDTCQSPATCSRTVCVCE
ncbi:MAG: hypothetical protein JW797_17080 [Bradymonadales bacterium]|nr:hypothetical protein [Bradymonadales bacterium]